MQAAVKRCAIEMNECEAVPLVLPEQVLETLDGLKQNGAWAVHEI